MSSLADQAIYELPAYGVSNLYFSVYPNEENWELSLWIKNLADKSYRTRTKSDGLMSYMDVFGEPRFIWSFCFIPMAMKMQSF